MSTAAVLAGRNPGEADRAFDPADFLTYVWMESGRPALTPHRPLRRNSRAWNAIKRVIDSPLK